MNLFSRTRRSGFTLVELLVVIAIIGVLVALLLPAVQAAREAARRMSCGNNLKQIAIGMHNYSDTHGSFPPGAIYHGTGAAPQDGRNANWGATWVVMMLPFIEQGNLHSKYDFTLTARTGGATTANNMVTRTQLKATMCPSHPIIQTRLNQDFDGFAKGNYAANAGGRRMLNTSDADNSAFKGPFSVVRQFGARFADITDGTSNSAMASEIVAIDSGGDDRGAWGWCTGPLFSGGNNNCSGPSGAPTGFAVLTPNCKTRYDCSHYSINDTTNANVNRRSDPDAAGEAGVGARSYHPAGVQMAICDGSVRFVSSTVNATTYVNFLAISDGNSTNLD